MNFLCNGFDIIDRSQDVTGMSHSYQSSFVAQELSQDFWLELRILLVVRLVPLEIRVTILRKLYPGCYVSLMVQF